MLFSGLPVASAMPAGATTPPAAAASAAATFAPWLTVAALRFYSEYNVPVDGDLKNCPGFLRLTRDQLIDLAEHEGYSGKDGGPLKKGRKAAMQTSIMSTRNTRMEQRPPRREPVPKRKLDAPAGKFKPTQQDADALKAFCAEAPSSSRADELSALASKAGCDFLLSHHGGPETVLSSAAALKRFGLVAQDHWKELCRSSKGRKKKKQPPASASSATPLWCGICYGDDHSMRTARKKDTGPGTAHVPPHRRVCI